MATKLARSRRLLAGWLVLAACGPAGGETTGSAGVTTSGTDAPSTGAGPTTPTSSGAASSESSGGASSSGDATTGSPLERCDPGLAPLPEDEFAERFAAAICAQKTSCGCEVDFACETSLKEELAGVREGGKSLGYSYDGVCAANKLLGLVEQQGCKLASEIVPGPDCAFFCPVYRGAVEDGESCLVLPPPIEITSWFMEACADPNECNLYDMGTCAPAFPQVGVREPCRDEQSIPTATCEASYCDPQGTCVPIAEEGESCDGRPCASLNFHCSPEKVCVPYLDAGAACSEDGACRSQRCSEGACEDRVWICQVEKIVDLFTRNPDAT